MPTSIYFALLSYCAVKICTLFTFLGRIIYKIKENQNKIQVALTAQRKGIRA